MRFFGGQVRVLFTTPSRMSPIASLKSGDTTFLLLFETPLEEYALGSLGPR